jgi:AbrB family looped-hinge helix DNA binding protein
MKKTEFCILHKRSTSMTMVAEVTQRGQVTIPKRMRDKHGLTQGTEVEIVDLDGSIMIVPRETVEAVNRMHANFDRMREKLVAANVTLEDMMDALRRVREASE